MLASFDASGNAAFPSSRVRMSDDRPAPRLTVVLMAFNEAESLPAVAHEIHDALERLATSYQLLIVDDGSSDGSGAIADGLATELAHTRVVHHQGNQGLGAVYRTGFAEARGDLMTFFPADGQFAATIIAEYLRALDGHDLILGTLPERKDALLGRALSFAERLLLRALFGHFPRFQGIVMFRRSLLDGMNLASRGRGWTVLMELILRAERKSARIKNVPITVRPRRSGASKVNNLRSIASNLQQVLALRLHL
jgi:glycosyltransferase involved in cell wall biosynthesis